MDQAKTTSTPPGQYFVRDFIIYSELGVPRVDIGNYRLRITGLVERELEFSYDELLRLPQVKVVADSHCVTKWSVKNVEWEGVQIRFLADKAGVKPVAKWVMFHCLDGYTAPVPIEDALMENAIIALKMNGEPLKLENGWPARPFIPHLYLWKSAKWLCMIEFIENYVDGYWEARGYHERGNVWLEERFKKTSDKHHPRKPI
jgi:DMSO/TMAO reductase YedYZ molybdopterin-dependent catalytic subunit